MTIWVVRIFLYSSSVYSCHLFLISSPSVRSRPFLSFTEPIFAWNFPLVALIFLKRSLVFPNLLFSSFSLYFYPLFLNSSASLMSISFLSFIEPIFAWNVPLVSLVFLKRPLVFPFLLFSSISSHWSLKKPFLSLLAVFRISHSVGNLFPFLLCP